MTEWMNDSPWFTFNATKFPDYWVEEKLLYTYRWNFLKIQIFVILMFHYVEVQIDELCLSSSPVGQLAGTVR